MAKIQLGEACNIMNGYAFKSEKYVDSGIRVIRITNVQKGFVEDDKPQFYHLEEEKNLKDYILEKDDLLISLTGNVGRVAMLEEKWLPAALNQRVACLRIKNSNIVKKYIYYALLSNRFEDDCIVSAKGIAQKNMSTEWLKEYKISCPSVDKQLDIVNVFDKLSSIISNKKKELKNFNILIKARFVEMFGDPEINDKRWKICKLEKICNVGSSKRIYQSEQSSSGVPFLRISDLVNKMDTGSTECELFIPEQKYKELKENKLVPTQGDILVTARGTLGRCYIVDADDRFYFQDGMITWLSNFNQNITSIYISYLFSIEQFRKQIDKLQAGSTIAYLSISMAKKLDVMLPPIELQTQFAAFVHQVDKSKVVCVNNP